MRQVSTLPKQEIAARVTDISRASDQLPIIILFPKSTSISHAMAVQAAQRADRHMSVVDGEKIVAHLAAFSSNRDQLICAQTLARLVMGLRGVQIWVNGALQGDRAGAWRFIEVLDCYLASPESGDWRAYCQIAVDDPFTATGEGRRGPYLLPCHYMYRWGTSGYNLSLSHPSSLADQVAASGRRVGCDWCPNFKPSEIRRLAQD